MPDALAAELLKLRRHKATWFLVWIFPIGCVVLFATGILVDLFDTSGPVLRPPRPEAWIGESASVWQVPASSLGRILISAYVAVVFAGEYGWNTWKLIVPHRARAALIAAKFALVVLLLAVAYALTGILSIAMMRLEDALTGDAFPAGVTVGALVAAHAQAALAASAAALLTIAYTALAAVLTRSTIAALVIAIVVVTVDSMFTQFAPLLFGYMPGPVWALFHALPGYHVANLSSWIGDGAALRVPFPDGAAVVLSWPASVAVVGAWIGGLAFLTFAAFRRQDIN